MKQTFRYRRSKKMDYSAGLVVKYCLGPPPPHERGFLTLTRVTADWWRAKGAIRVRPRPFPGKNFGGRYKKFGGNATGN